MRQFGLVASTVLTATLWLLLTGCERDETPTPAPKPAQPAAATTQPTADELANVRAFMQDKGTREAE